MKKIINNTILILAFISALVFSSCSEPVEFKIDDNFFKEWKVQSIEALNDCCNSAEKSEHLLSESRRVFSSRKELFNVLMTKINVNDENTFLITESIQDKGVIGGRWMNLETKNAYYKAYYLYGVLTTDTQIKESAGFNPPTESICCDKLTLEDYIRSRGFISLQYLTLYEKKRNKFVRTVYARGS